MRIDEAGDRLSLADFTLDRAPADKRIISGRLIEWSLVVSALLILAAIIGSACSYPEDDSAEGKKAILMTMNYKVPLGFSVDTGIRMYIGDLEKRGKEIQRVGWAAFRRRFMLKGYRVEYRFTTDGREMGAYWIVDVDAGTVVPDNTTAKSIMRVQ